MSERTSHLFSFPFGERRYESLDFDSRAARTLQSRFAEGVAYVLYMSRTTTDEQLAMANEFIDRIIPDSASVNELMRLVLRGDHTHVDWDADAPLEESVNILLRWFVGMLRHTEAQALESRLASLEAPVDAHEAAPAADALADVAPPGRPAAE